MKLMKCFPLQFLLYVLFAASVSAATVDDIKIYSSTTGKGPGTVILVHGWTCDSSSWQFQVPELSKDYRVITLDLPGHGQSGSPEDGVLSMDLFARAVEAVRAEAKADRVALAGHSMGAAVILQYARMYPQHVAALVSVDGLVTGFESSKAPPFNAEQFAGPEGMKMREGMIRGMFSTLTTEDMQKHILSMMLAAPPSTASGAMKAIMDPALWQEGVIPQPLLGIYAGNSALGPDPEQLKIRFPNLEFEIIPDTGHFLMIEKPEEFNRLLKSFLDRQKY
jgi:pimeloyl-ACP methyl ester carboxylesterase